MKPPNHIVRAGLLLTALASTGSAPPPPTAAPSSRPDTCAAEVGLRAELDTQNLGEDGTAEMLLEVTGTEAAVEIRLLNLTPGVVSLEGGDEQRVASSGGRPNRLHRTLSTYRPGRFQIDYRLAEDPCPPLQGD